MMDEATFNNFMEMLVMSCKQGGAEPHEILLRVGSPVPGLETPESLYPVNVRPSDIHGLGVFATHPIKKGQVITMYPVHAVAYVDDATGQAKVLSPDEGFAKEFQLEYSMGIPSLSTPDSNVYICADPRKPVVRSHCAHFINDPYPMCNEIDPMPKNAEAYGKAFLDYEIRVQGSANAKLVSKDHYGYAVATRDIEADQEVLAPYDISYWNRLTNVEQVEYLKEYVETLNPAQRKYYLQTILARAANKELLMAQ